MYDYRHAAGPKAKVTPFSSLTTEEKSQLLQLTRGPSYSMSTDLTGKMGIKKSLAVMVSVGPKIVAWWSLFRPKPNLMLVNAFTASAHRGKGYGKLAGKTAILHAKSLGVNELRAQAEDASGAALYRALGFVPDKFDEWKLTI